MGLRLMQTSSHIDWLSVTFKHEIDLTGVLPRELGSGYWAAENGGLNGYKMRHSHPETGVTGLSDGNADMGVHTIANGANLAQIRDMGVSDREYVSYVVLRGGKVARIDLALDVHDGVMNVSDYANAYESQTLVTKAMSGTRWHTIGGKGETLYLGKRTSQRMARIYDKAAEMGIDGQWIRLEIECKAEYARAVAASIQAHGTRETINRAMRDFIAFPSSREYEQITADADATIEAIEKPLSATYKWLIEVAAPSLARYAAEHPDEDVITAFDTARREYGRSYSPLKKFRQTLDKS